MGDQKKRESEGPAASELDDGELEQVQGGGVRAATGNTRSLKLGGSLKRLVLRNLSASCESIA